MAIKRITPRRVKTGDKELDKAIDDMIRAIVELQDEVERLESKKQDKA